nr:PREDICTED: ankyrin repeat domain-containing protein 13B [Lepisosteus oculatus]
MISTRRTPEKSKYPLHTLVWYNRHRQLEKELTAEEQVRRSSAPQSAGLGRCSRGAAQAVGKTARKAVANDFGIEGVWSDRAASSGVSSRGAARQQTRCRLPAGVSCHYRRTQPRCRRCRNATERRQGCPSGARGSEAGDRQTGNGFELHREPPRSQPRKTQRAAIARPLPAFSAARVREKLATVLRLASRARQCGAARQVGEGQRVDGRAGTSRHEPCGRLGLWQCVLSRLSHYFPDGVELPPHESESSGAPVHRALGAVRECVAPTAPEPVPRSRKLTPPLFSRLSPSCSVLQEAVSTRDPELVRLVLRYRDYQRTVKRLAGIPLLLEKLRQAQDFYVEMKWEFTSWVPLVSRICPSDTYRVWKRGQSLRVDTTLLGFDHMTWQRGSRSFIFRGQGETRSSSSSSSSLRSCLAPELLPLEPLSRSSEPLLRSKRVGNRREVEGQGHRETGQPQARSLPVNSSDRLNQLLSSLSLCLRNKTGILGWRSEKTEIVNGYETKVYGASNVELITRTRTDHLADQHKGKSRGIPGPWPLARVPPRLSVCVLCRCPESLLSVRTDCPCWFSSAGARVSTCLSGVGDPPAPSQDRAGFPTASEQPRARRTEFLRKSLRTHTRLTSQPSHVSPCLSSCVSTEIPIYHILNARITFGNLNGCEEGGGWARDSPSTDTPSPGSDSSSVSSSSSTTSCRGGEIPACLFEVPRGYTVLGSHRDNLREEEEDLLQFAIQQSLLEAGSEYDQVTIWEALTNSKPGTHPLSCDGSRLQRTPQHRPHPQPSPHSTPTNPVLRSYDEQLRLAMELSAREQEEAEQRQRQEEEELERIIQLSLMEK